MMIQMWLPFQVPHWSQSSLLLGLLSPTRGPGQVRTLYPPPKDPKWLLDHHHWRGWRLVKGSLLVGHRAKANWRHSLMTSLKTAVSSKIARIALWSLTRIRWKLRCQRSHQLQKLMRDCQAMTSIWREGPRNDTTSSISPSSTQLACCTSVFSTPIRKFSRQTSTGESTAPD